MLANVEEPDFGYLDPTTPNCKNLIALLSKQTFKTLDLFELEKMEIANCVIEIKKQPTLQQNHTMASGSAPSLNLILVGTAFLDSESMPSKGRLLVFNLNTKECKLDLLKQVDLAGSIQAIGTLRDNHRFLVVGQNNKVALFSFGLDHHRQVSLQKLDCKVSGAFVQAIRTIED